MADLGGSTIASTYQAILALPLTGGDATNLVALTDGDGVNTFALSVATTSIAISPTDKFYFDDGGNTYIHEGGADRLDFVVGGDTNGFVLLEGSGVTKVGIGLLAPSVNLHIYRDTSDETSLLRLEEDGVGDAKMAYTLSGSSAWQTGIDNTDNAFKIASQETGAWTDTRLTILTDGKVGIGTDTPDQLLEISADVSAQLLVTTYNNSATTNSHLVLRTADGTEASEAATDSGDVLGDLDFQGNDGDSFEMGVRIRAMADENWSGSARGTNLTFHTVDNTTTGLDERMRIDHNGNVGIGVANPDAPLEVTNTAESGADQNVAHFSTEKGANLYLRNSDLSSDEGDWSFVGGANEDICIIPTGNGNVGIGFDSPSATLELYRATDPTSLIIGSNDDNATLTLSADVGDTASGTNQDPRIRLYSADAEVWGIFADNDDAQKDFNIASGGISGTVRDHLENNSAGWKGTSDERIKDNLEDIGSMLDKVKDVRCIYYNPKFGDDEEKNRKVIGFVAQDLVDVCPGVNEIVGKVDEDFKIVPECQAVEAVDEVKDADGNITQAKVKKVEYARETYSGAMSVGYSRMTVVLMKCIQELSAKVTALENA